MNKQRPGEQRTPIPQKNERYYCINGEWFFKTRNEGLQGPYSSKPEMEDGLLHFIASKSQAL